MKAKLFILCFFVGSLFFSSCNQNLQMAKNNYQVGNFDAATRYSVATLRENPNKTAAQRIIQGAFKAAINDYTDKIAKEKAISAQFRNDETVNQRSEVVNLYEKMIDLQKQVKSLPPMISKDTKQPIVFETKDYYNELNEAQSSLEDAKQAAAEQHYKEGKRLMEGDLESNKRAAKEFKAAMNFVPNYKDANSLYDQSRKTGTKRMAIIPFVNKSGKTHFGEVGEVQSDLIIASVVNDKGASEFLDIITRDQLDLVLKEQKLNDLGVIDENSLVEVGKILGVHEILTGKITQIAIQNPQTVSRSYIEKGKIVVRQEEYYEDGKKKKRDIYGEASVNVTEYTKEATASIVGSYSIIDVKTAKVKNSDSFSESYRFKCTWGTYSGEPKVLSYHSRELCGQSEQISPSSEEMVRMTNEQLAKKLARKIIEYAK